MATRSFGPLYLSVTSWSAEYGLPRITLLGSLLIKPACLRPGIVEKRREPKLRALLQFTKLIPKKVLGLSIGFTLPSKGTGASYYRKIVLRGMYRVAALRL